MKLKFTHLLLPAAIGLTAFAVSQACGQTVDTAESSVPPVEASAESSSALAPSQPEPAPAKAPPAPLELVCDGGVGGTMADVPSGNLTAGDYLKFGLKGGNSFGAQIRVRLFTGDDRIKLPDSMLPPLRGGDRGWYKIQNLKVTDKVIAGRAAVNYVNTPVFRIDRVTAEIKISGPHGHFSGTCRKIEPETAKPQF